MQNALQPFSIDSFIAPVCTDGISNLLTSYNKKKAQLQHVSDLMGDADVAQVLPYFADNLGNSLSSSRLASLFCLPGAIAHLNADYWRQALTLTDVYEVMPQARRDEWNEKLRHPLGVKKSQYGDDQDKWEIAPVPEFEDDIVRSTLLDLLHARSRFFCERVDGIFRALSGSHVTNRPEGFSKRLILNNAFELYGHLDLAMINHSKVGALTDLRRVIAQIMGRVTSNESDVRQSSSALMTLAREKHTGKWLDVDGGALRLRAYKKGTLHVEIHPDLVWKLNSVLAHLHPAAIPSSHRTAPKRTSKTWGGLRHDFLCPEVLTGLQGMRGVSVDPSARGRVALIPNALLLMPNKDTSLTQGIEDVLTQLGAVYVPRQGLGYWQFSYDPTSVIELIVRLGHMPDKVSAQYYPTLPELAKKVIDEAHINEHHSCLEPSAGQGGLVDLLPNKDNVTCVEISQLHCEVLQVKGYSEVVCTDFLKMKPNNGLFDRIVMNPPFAKGQAEAHVRHAIDFLDEGGVLVAVLPASMKGKTLVNVNEGAEYTESWSDSIAEAFKDTQVRVVLYTLYK